MRMSAAHAKDVRLTIGGLSLTDDSQARTYPHSAAFAVMVYLLVFPAAVVVYYAMLAAVSVLSITASLGSSGTPDPAWLESVVSFMFGVLLFAGPLWGLAAASLAHGAFAQRRSPTIRTRIVGVVRVLGVAAMTACLGLWPSVFVRASWSLQAALIGALVGFFVGAVVMGVVEVRLQPSNLTSVSSGRRTVD